MSGCLTYELGRATYVNLTNRCTNDCAFCVRQFGDGVGGYDLRLNAEPSGEDVIAALDEKRPRQVVFCGFGEPTINLDALLQAAAFVKSYGGSTRINTNGHANRFHGRDVTGDLAKVIDEASISLNAPTAETYAQITRCRYGEEGFRALLEFTARCLQNGIRVTMTAVDVISKEKMAACEEIARRLGAAFRARPFVE